MEGPLRAESTTISWAIGGAGGGGIGAQLARRRCAQGVGERPEGGGGSGEWGVGRWRECGRCGDGGGDGRGRGGGAFDGNRRLRRAYGHCAARREAEGDRLQRHGAGGVPAGHLSTR